MWSFAPQKPLLPPTPWNEELAVTERYNVIIASDPEHEKVFAEIQCDNKFLALISQEEGEDRLLVELPGLGLDEYCVVRQARLTDFIDVLNQAADKLVGKRWNGD